MGDEGISVLTGDAILHIEGAEKQSNKIVFSMMSGRHVCLYHEQDCCEQVYLEDIVGDLKDLLYCEVLNAELVHSSDEDSCGDHVTWSFYKIRTSKGEVTLRWYGTSNGYYSETVDLLVTEYLNEALAV